MIWSLFGRLQSHQPLVQSSSCGSILPRMFSLSNKDTEPRRLHKGTNTHSHSSLDCNMKIHLICYRFVWVIEINEIHLI